MAEEPRCSYDRAGAVWRRLEFARPCRRGRADDRQHTEPAGRRSRPAIEKVYPALVRIYVVAEEPSGGRMERRRAAGSGVIISNDGYVVTNHHVAGNAVRMTCTLADGEEVEAARVGTDPLADICRAQAEARTRASTPTPPWRSPPGATPAS